MIFTKLNWVACFATSLLLSHAMAGENLLLGKSYRFWTPPNYAYCTGESDLRDLTDGRFAQGPEIWRDQATVGWKVRDGAAMVEFDLGKPMVMERLRFHTVAGRAGTRWPLAIHLYGSVEGTRWEYLGDAMEGLREGLPKVDEEQEGTAQKEALLHWIESQPLKVLKAYRHLAVAVESDFFVFCDEVELIAGALPQEEDGQQARPQLEGEKGVREHLSGVILTRAIRRRLLDDADALTALAKRQEAGVAVVEKVSSLKERIATMEPVAKATFKDTTFPLHPLHSELFAHQAELWRGAAEGKVTLWKSHRHDALPVVHLPEQTESMALKGSVLLGGRWTDAIWISNSGSEPVELLLSLEGDELKTGGEVKVFQSAWHDTKDGIPVHSLLEPLQAGQSITLQPGLSGRLWLELSGEKAGVAKGTVVIRQGADLVASVPLEVTVLDVRQPSQELSVVLWDYMDRGGLYGLNKANLFAAKKLVEDRFQYAPWASSRVAPKPMAAAFDEKHQMVTPAQFPGLKEWLEEVVPGKPLYGIFLIASHEFAGLKLGEAGYEARVTAWIKELANHLVSYGYSPEQFVLAAVDEPHSDAEDRLSLAWTRAIKAADKRFLVMVNPTYARPDTIRHQGSITEADIIMPRSNLYQQEGEPVVNYFEALRKGGRQLWFYTCEGGRPTDPTQLYRKMAWLAWMRKAEGVGFWALGDAGGGSSWNEYDASLPTGTPVFLSSTRAENAIELEALAEGLADHALLCSLENAAAAESAPAEWKAAANALMEEIRTALGTAAYVRPPAKGADRLEGWKSADARKLDVWRARAMELLDQKPQ